MHRTPLACGAVSLRQTLPNARFLTPDDVVAGSAGKTVTAMLLASIFEAAGEPVGEMSSLGHSDSLVQQPPTAPTPSAPEFATWLARMHVAGCRSAVLEFSSQAIAERRTSGI